MLFLICLHLTFGATGANQGESCERATTKEECENLARRFALPDTTAFVIDTIARPPHCYYVSNNYEAKRLFFNLAYIGNTSPCTDYRKCVCKNDCPSIVSPNDELLAQSKRGNVSGVAFILNYCRWIDVNTEDESTFTPLLWASLKGYQDVVRLLLNTDGIKLDKVTDTGFSPLMAASKKGYTEIVRMILDELESSFLQFLFQ